MNTSGYYFVSFAYDDKDGNQRIGNTQVHFPDNISEQLLLPWLTSLVEKEGAFNVQIISFIKLYEILK